MEAVSSVTPIWVLNIRLNLRMAVKLCLPQLGQTTSSWLAMKASISSKLMASTLTLLPDSAASMSLSARCRAPQPLQSTSGSEKLPTWPVVTQVWGFMMMAASRPTL